LSRLSRGIEMTEYADDHDDDHPDRDGRPLLDADRLLDRLRAVHGEPRYDLACPLPGPPSLKRRGTHAREKAQERSTSRISEMAQAR